MSENSNKFPAILITLLLLCGGVLLFSRLIGRSAPTYNATVSGTVTIGEILAESGVVTFHPVAGGQPVVGNIHADGSYSLRSGQGDLSDPDGGTIASGKYIVTVAINGPSDASVESGAPPGEVPGVSGPPLPGPSLIAAKYQSKAASDLNYVVKPGQNVFVLNLEAAGAAEAAADATDGPAEGEPATEKGGNTDSAAGQDSGSEETAAAQEQLQVEAPDSINAKDGDQ